MVLHAYPWGFLVFIHSTTDLQTPPEPKRVAAGSIFLVSESQPETKRRVSPKKAMAEEFT